MSNEWTDLKDLQAVADAQADGWEIELNTELSGWNRWGGESWCNGWRFRGRPKQPKKVTVTSECWRYSDGAIAYRTPAYNEFYSRQEGWQRFPAGDITGEVEE